MMLKLGKRPAQPGAVRFKLQQFVDLSAIPPVPEEFGHEALVPNWGTLGNDRWGCCVFSGFAHQSMLWCAEGRRIPPGFTDEDIAADYGAVTGFRPDDPSTDQGTQVAEALKYWRTTGIRDEHGSRHKIAAYLDLDVGNIQHLWASIYLFGSVGIGFEVPAFAMDQFRDGHPWDLSPGADDTIKGGHYVPLVSKRSGAIRAVTWGQLQPMTIPFYQRFNDESHAMVSEEMLSDAGKSPEGFDRDQLLADLQAL